MRNIKQYRTIARQKGLTLLELLLAIGLVAVIIGIAIVVFGQTQASSNSYKGTQNILTVSSAIKSLYPTPNYTGLTSTVVVNSKKVPETYVSGATIINPWGQTVALAPVNQGGTNNAFTITSPGIPTNECNAIAASVQANFSKITIGTTVVKDSTAATPVAYDTAATVTACNVAATNTMIFQGV